MVDVCLESDQNLSDLLCTMGFATTPLLLDLSTIPNGHAGSSENDLLYYAPMSCIELPQRQVGTMDLYILQLDVSLTNHITAKVVTVKE